MIEGATAAICVSDDGTGVPDDVAGAFFEPKNRRRTMTAGAGLGLSIARGIVGVYTVARSSCDVPSTAGRR